MYIMHVTYQVKPGQKEAFLQAIAAEGIDTASRQEQGCVRYDYFYSAQQEDAVLLLELWESQEAQAAHTKTAHFQKLGPIKEAYVVQTTVEKYIGE